LRGTVLHSTGSHVAPRREKTFRLALNCQAMSVGGTAMRRRLSFRLRASAVALGVAGTMAFSLTGGAPASAGSAPYLALGDSIVFGFITHDGPAYGNPDNFIGYPQIVGSSLNAAVSNAACPGEATTSFVSATGADNGCRTSYKLHFPLHVSYAGTQEAYALSFLAAHPQTKLVTVSLGANDGFLLQEACASSPTPATCVAAGLPAVLGTVAANMDSILGAIRDAGFHGTLIVVNYYSLDYTDAAGTALSTLLNTAETGSAAAHGAVVADVFSAFQTAASGAGGHTCFAGLLNANPSDPTNTTCDVHPSITGQNLIAQTVLSTFAAARAAG